MVLQLLLLVLDRLTLSGRLEERWSVSTSCKGSSTDCMAGSPEEVATG